MSIEKINGLVVVACDLCGEELLELLTTHKEAAGALREAGWKTSKTDHGWENLCPACGDD